MSKPESMSIQELQARLLELGVPQESQSREELVHRLEKELCRQERKKALATKQVDQRRQLQDAKRKKQQQEKKQQELPQVPPFPDLRKFRFSYNTEDEYQAIQDKAMELVLQHKGPMVSVCPKCYEDLKYHERSTGILEMGVLSDDDDDDEKQELDIYILTQGMPFEDVWTNEEIDEFLTETMCPCCRYKVKQRIVDIKRAFIDF